MKSDSYWFKNLIFSMVASFICTIQHSHVRIIFTQLFEVNDLDLKDTEKDFFV